VYPCANARIDANNTAVMLLSGGYQKIGWYNLGQLQSQDFFGVGVGVGVEVEGVGPWWLLYAYSWDGNAVWSAGKGGYWTQVTRLANIISYNYLIILFITGLA
jgi:hypothetical protein